MVDFRINWGWFIIQGGFVPHILTYEDLCENPVESVRGILAFLQFDKNHIEINKENLPTRQSDATSEKWYRRYILDGNKLSLPERKK